MNRWLVVIVFILSSALNYLDRLLLPALAPTIMEEFSLSASGFGYVLSAFSIVYACSSPLMGWLIDRIGLRWGAALAVALWSTAGAATGLAVSFPALIACRALLGLAESGGIPASAKAMATYLPARDQALGSALSQLGLTLGSSLAPLLVTWVAPLWGWRATFVIAGLLGFVWIPLWLAVSRGVPPLTSVQATRPSTSAMFRDARFVSLLGANIVAMTVYSLWTNWTTLFLVRQTGLSQNQVNARLAWIPPIAATLGGLTGGWLARRLISQGMPPLTARLRASLIGALLALLMALAAVVKQPTLATAAICCGLFGTLILSVNYYTIPLDLFGATRAAFAVSMLTGAFGLMQTLLSPAIGALSEAVGWAPLCFTIALMPLFSVLLLRAAFRR